MGSEMHPEAAGLNIGSMTAKSVIVDPHNVYPKVA